jgi:hypothetical protein
MLKKFIFAVAAISAMSVSALADVTWTDWDKVAADSTVFYAVGKGFNGYSGGTYFQIKFFNPTTTGKSVRWQVTTDAGQSTMKTGTYINARSQSLPETISAAGTPSVLSIQELN